MTFDYEQIRASVEAGQLVVVAVGRVGDRPACRLLNAPLVRFDSIIIAHDRDSHVRVGQMLGALEALREHHRARGFTPAE